MAHIFWEKTISSDVFQVCWSSESEYQCNKPVEDHLAELRDNGMLLEGGLDVSPGTVLVGDYVTIDGSNLTKVAKPETPEETESRLADEAAAATLNDARERLQLVDSDGLDPVIADILKALRL